MKYKYLNRFPLGTQDPKYFIGYKDNKEVRPLCIFFPEMSIFKRYSDKIKWKNEDLKKFWKKKKFFFDKRWKNIWWISAIWENVSNIKKKLIVNLYIKIS